MKQCFFCTNNIKKVDYKEINTLKNFTDTQGKIIPKRQSNLCVKHQKRVTWAIKRARFLALLPFVKE